ncbi:phosphotransferase family protein [Mycobacterium sp. UM_CSW]|uniref:phosphotransferase family protein n=1 Tax=Mycobacterium sp. UM_CSW TaxID=1370119 RepID=UPI000835C8B8|nr:phosphotransferase family protein [Mycobacterium sp. UM_CSW]
MSAALEAHPDLERVARWLDEHHPPGAELTDVSPMGGGTQNVMVRFRRGGRRLVLRRPPPHPRATSNDALRREMRVLDALNGTAVPAPRLVAQCPSTDVLGGAVFYLMDDVDGVNLTVELPPTYANDSAVRCEAGLAAARAAAALGAVDPAAVGLTDLGRPKGFLERQVPRWRRELDSYSELDGYPGPQLPEVGAVGDWLERHRPAPAPPGLMHGDFHLANIMFRADRPEVAAIVDWEMATVGDPLLDLGWLLATWPVPGEDGVWSGTPVAEAGGLATREDLVAAYAEHSDRDLSAIDWYQILACFKLGILLEGTHARACAGKAPKATGDKLHRNAVALFDQALRHLH